VSSDTLLVAETDGSSAVLIDRSTVFLLTKKCQLSEEPSGEEADHRTTGWPDDTLARASVGTIKAAVSWGQKTYLERSFSMPTEFQQLADLRSSVKDRFRRVALAPDLEKKFPIGLESARSLGYDPAEIASLLYSLTESFCGVGNPFSLGQPLPGERVLDLGCGAGFDTILAARKVGPNGQVMGIDMTPEMIAKARSSAKNLKLTNVEFVLGEIESIPMVDASVHLVISNGVFNLCPDKPKVLSEVFRVLNAGGRLQMADIFLEPHVPPQEVATKGSWSD
jgi:arsenite methyltransferase